MFAISMLCEYIVPHNHAQNVLLAYATFGLFSPAIVGFCPFAIPRPTCPPARQIRQAGTMDCNRTAHH
jgi:hypothetical protein